MNFCNGYSRAFELQWQLKGLFEQHRKILLKKAGHDEFSPKDVVDAQRYSALESNQVYYFSKEISDFIMQSAYSVPNLVLKDSDIASESVFWYFSEPLKIVDSYIGPIRAISWACVYKFADSNQTWMPVMDDSPPHNPLLLWITFYQEGHNISPVPVPATQIPWYFGESMEETLKKSNSNLSLGQETRPIKLQLLIAALMFIKQKLFSQQKLPVDRATRKRTVGRKTIIPHINVYFLRKVHSKNHRAGSSEIAWTCRWSVRGHWRQQMVGAGRTEPRIVWVIPHIKGPEDKEIKSPSKTLFAVVR